MADVETELRIAFYDAVIAFGADQSLKIADPNVPFNPNDASDLPAGDKHYLRTSVLPIPLEHVGVNNDEARYLWIGQISVYARDGIGELAPLRIAQLLRAAYPRFYEFAGSTLKFRVERTGDIKPPVSRGGWFFFPVQFRIQTFT